MIKLEDVVRDLNYKFNLFLKDSPPFPKYSANTFEINSRLDHSILDEGLEIKAVYGRCAAHPEGTGEANVRYEIGKFINNLSDKEAIEHIEEKVGIALFQIRKQLRKDGNL
jgi:hypothetical protein